MQTAHILFNNLVGILASDAINPWDHSHDLAIHIFSVILQFLSVLIGFFHWYSTYDMIRIIFIDLTWATGTIIDQRDLNFMTEEGGETRWAVLKWNSASLLHLGRLHNVSCAHAEFWRAGLYRQYPLCPTHGRLIVISSRTTTNVSFLFLRLFHMWKTSTSRIWSRLWGENRLM